jgi:hypothetical protein
MASSTSAPQRRSSTSGRRLEARVAKEREASFNLTTADARIPEYSSLTDRNMAAYYEKRTVRKRMQAKGFMDAAGRTYNMDKKKAAINVVEQEFKKVQRAEQQREQVCARIHLTLAPPPSDHLAPVQEERELRRRIQAHRRAVLEKEQRERMLQDLKADRALGQEVVRLSRAVSLLTPCLSLSLSLSLSLMPPPWPEQVIQPELNPGGISSLLSETASSAPMSDEEEEESAFESSAAEESGPDLAGMTEQERRLMKAMNVV